MTITKEVEEENFHPSLSPYQEWRLHNGEVEVPDWFIRWTQRVEEEAKKEGYDEGYNDAMNEVLP